MYDRRRKRATACYYSRRRRLPVVTPDDVCHIHRQLRKISVWKATSKIVEARRAVQNLKERFQNVNTIAKIAGETTTVMYRLLRLEAEILDHGKLLEREAKYKKKFTRETNRQITDFMQCEAVSYCIPEAKYAGLFFFKYCVAEVHKMFLRENPTIVVSASHFYKLKPTWIKTVDQTPDRRCVCDTCENIKLAGQVLRAAGLTSLSTNPREVMKRTWCKIKRKPMEAYLKEFTTNKRPGSLQANPDFPPPSCVHRRCNECGVKQYLHALILKHADILTENKKIGWVQWKHVTVSKTKSMMDLVDFEGTVSQLLLEYMTQMHDLSEHLFCYYWQVHMFRVCQQNLSSGQVLVVHDFGQFFLLKFQNEPKPVHWDHCQVNIHPSVCYYRCHCGGLVTEEVVHLAANIRQEQHDVHHYQLAVIDFLKSKGVEVREVVEFTDNSAKQYNSCHVFDVLTRFDIPITRHYYGPGHGKSSADHCTGVVKQQLQRDVRSTAYVIKNLPALFRHFSSKHEIQHRQTRSRGSCLHSQRKFLLAPDAIPRLEDQALTLNETRKIFSVKTTGQRSVVKVRNVSCCCNDCLHGRVCTNEYVDDWRVLNVCDKAPRRSTRVPVPVDRVFIATVLAEKQNPIVLLRKLTVPAIRQQWKGKAFQRIPVKELVIQPPVIGRQQKRCSVKAETEPGTQPKRSSVKAEAVPDIQRKRCSVKAEVVPGIQPKRSSVKAAMPDIQRKRSPVKEEAAMPGIQRKRSPVKDPVVPGFNWRAILRCMEKTNTYKALETLVTALRLPPLQEKLKWRMTRRDQKDAIAETYIPADVPKKLCPVITVGDGNCFLYALSHILTSTPDNHIEIRVRIVAELVSNQEQYLSNSYLNKGTHQDQKNRAMNYAFQSVGYDKVNFTRATPTVIKHIFEADVMEIKSNYKAVGMWAIFAASNVARREIFVVFPGPAGVARDRREDLHRRVIPIKDCGERREIVIMWTPMHRNAKIATECIHFVPLMCQVIIIIFRYTIDNFRYTIDDSLQVCAALVFMF